MKINVFAFALAFGVWLAVGLFIVTWWLILSGSSADSLATVRQLFIGYSVTPVGSVVGLVEGFVCGTISGAILVNIEPEILTLGGPISYRADVSIKLNPDATIALTEAEIDYLKSLDFNRWRYAPISYDANHHRVLSRRLSMAYTASGFKPVKIELPANLILEALAGRKSFADHLVSYEGDPVYEMITSGRMTIRSCEYKKGDAEKGLPDTVVLELVEAFEPVFSRK